jgi:signal transduction histidine kinase
LVFETTGSPFEVPTFVAGNMLLVAQEAIHNALHHARCSTIEATVAFDEPRGGIELRIHDDGIGFEPGTQVGPTQGHFGLQGMRERIERLGGTLAISSHPGGGTTVRASVLTRDYDAHLEGDD